MRRTRRGPGHRSNIVPLTAAPQLAVEVLGLTSGGGETVLELGLMSNVASVDESTEPGDLQDVVLLSWQAEAWQPTALQMLEDGGVYARGRRAILTFTEETDPTLPWELRIPSTWQRFGTDVGGKLAGTFAEAQSGAGEEPPYVRVSNLPLLTSPFPELMWVTAVQADGSNTVTVTLTNYGLSSPVVVGNLTLAVNSTPTTATPVDLGGGQFGFTFGGAVLIADEISGGQWQPGIRGSEGAWLAPFQIIATA